MTEISKVIKKRLQDNNVRHFACDNVSEFIKEDEYALLIDEVADKFNNVLDALLIDTENDPNSKDTGRRLAKMYVKEIFQGRYYPRPDVTAFPNEGYDAYEGMIVIRADIKSVCSHHWQPVSGTAFIGIIPQGKVLGLSKYIRLAQWHSRRGTLQEELCQRIQKDISNITGTESTAVYIQATHGCCENRGVMQGNSLTQTTSLGGSFKTDAKVREEFYNNIKMQTSYSKGT